MNFYKLCEQMSGDQPKTPLIDSGLETKSMDVVRNGMQLRTGDCNDFWDDFISLCSNAEALSELLEVPTEKISKWATKIQDTITKIKNYDKNDTKLDQKKIMPTGNSVDTLSPPV